jgi:hypothetical protein
MERDRNNTLWTFLKMWDQKKIKYKHSLILCEGRLVFIFNLEVSSVNMVVQ